MNAEVKGSGAPGCCAGAPAEAAAAAGGVLRDSSPFKDPSGLEGLFLFRAREGLLPLHEVVHLAHEVST